MLAEGFVKQAWSTACNVRFELQKEFLFDPNTALRTPANTPWLLDDDNRMCHVARLPLAVLSLILCEYVLLPGDGQVLMLMRICKAWHAAIVQNNTLWRSVSPHKFSCACCLCLFGSCFHIASSIPCDGHAQYLATCARSHGIRYGYCDSAPAGSSHCSHSQLMKRRAALSADEVVIENCDAVDCPQLYKHLRKIPDVQCRECQVCRTDVPQAPSDARLHQLYRKGASRVAYAPNDLLGRSRDTSNFTD